MDFPCEGDEMIKSHPPAVSTFYFSLDWERFSYYGMRAILIPYLVKYFNYSDTFAGSVYGAYTGLVYLTPILGGYRG